MKKWLSILILALTVWATSGEVRTVPFSRENYYNQVTGARSDILAYTPLIGVPFTFGFATDDGSSWLYASNVGQWKTLGQGNMGTIIRDSAATGQGARDTLKTSQTRVAAIAAIPYVIDTAAIRQKMSFTILNKNVIDTIRVVGGGTVIYSGGAAAASAVVTGAKSVVSIHTDGYFVYIQ